MSTPCKRINTIKNQLISGDAGYKLVLDCRVFLLIAGVFANNYNRYIGHQGFLSNH